MGKARWFGILLAFTLLFPVLIIGSVHSLTPPEENWLSFRGGHHNQGFSSSQLGHLDLNWEFKADSSIGTTVVVMDDTCFFGTFNGTVYSLDRNSGAIKWKVNLGSPIYSTPSIDPETGTLYVCDGSGKVYSLDMGNGLINWQWDTGTGKEIQSSPLVIPGDKIYFGSYDSMLYAVELNGTLAWKFAGCSGWIHTSPSSLNEMVYFGSCDGTLRAVHSDTGEEIWSFTAEFIPSSPAIYANRIYFGAYDANMYCLNAMNGDVIWNTTMGDNVYSSPAVSSSNLVVGCNDGLLYCLSPSSGNILWTMDLGPSSLETSPLIAFDMGAVTYDQGLVIVNLDNGSIHQRFLYGDSSDVSPSVSEGMVFFGDSQGYVYKFQEKIEPKTDDDDDDHLDLNEELEMRRDVIYFILAFIIISGVVLFIYFKKYKHLRGAS